LLTVTLSQKLTSLEVIGSGNQKMADANLSAKNLQTICKSCPLLRRLCIRQALYQFTKAHGNALTQHDKLQYLHLELRKRTRADFDSEKLDPSALQILLTSPGPPLTLSITPSGIDPIANMETLFLGTSSAPHRVAKVIVNRHELFRNMSTNARLSLVDADALFPGSEAADMRFRQHMAAIETPERRRMFASRWVQTE